MFKLVNQVKFGTPNHNGGKSRVSAAHVVLEKNKKHNSLLQKTRVGGIGFA